jgi:predicted small secreted protein
LLRSNCRSGKRLPGQVIPIHSILAPHAASTRSKEIVMRKLFALFALAGVLLVTGCNTISGAGKDIERGGEKVQGAAENTKQKM